MTNNSSLVIEEWKWACVFVYSKYALLNKKY